MTPAPPPPTPAPRIGLAFPILATLVWVPAAVLSSLPAMVSVMALDAPGSEDNPWTRLFVVGSLAFPASCALSVVMAWPLWLLTRRWPNARHGLRALLWGATGCLPLLAAAVAAIGLGGVMLACGGQFAC
jgi:hypothetical protein